MANTRINEIVQLDDFVYTYPPQDDPNIQYLITAKEEFRQLASTISEKVPTSGELYKHQKLIRRLMLVYDRLLLIHRTGTGKSCAAFGTSEQFKLGMIGAVVDFINDYLKPERTHIKRIIVLTKGPALINELKRQLVCTCTGGEYETDLVKNSPNETARKKNITREIKKYYTMKTYGTFVGNIIKLGLTDEQIKQEYSSTLFIIDEAHNLHPDPNERVVASNENDDEDERTRALTEREEKKRTYQQLFRIFHIIERSKIMLLTATPMINDVYEISSLMNLILPIQNQIPHDPNILDFTNVGVNDMERYFRGKISYVRELDTGAVPEYVSNPDFSFDFSHEINGISYQTQMVIYANLMSEHQQSGYQYVSSGQQGQGRNSFYIRERQAANFIFPDGSSGDSTSSELKRGILRGFSKYLIKRGPDNYAPSEELSQYISNEEGLATLSSKYLNIIRLCRDKEGNCFCYSEFLKNGSILLGVCFESLGFERFAETQSVFTLSSSNDNKGKQRLPPYCSGKTGAEINRTIRIAPKLRYALLTSETPDNQIDTILKTFNSYENRHGDYIKVIIGSPVARIGINLSNVLQIHLVGPSWNQSNTYQAISRAIRSTSHVDIIKEKQEQTGNVNVRVPVLIYQHASVTTDGQSIDIDMYKLSEEKDIVIKRMERIMKQIAVDCQIHRQRNIRPETDIPGSPTCDYQSCEYQCSGPIFDPSVDKVDYTSFDVLYSDGLIDQILNDIKKIFNLQFSIKFDQLYAQLNQYARRYIDMAIEKIITEKIIIVDRYGYSAYLREDRNTLFLQRDYPLVNTNYYRSNYSLSLYGENLIANQSIKLADYLSTTQINDQVNIIEKLITISPNDPQFNDLLDQLNIESKVKFVEDWILRFVDESRRLITDENTLSIVTAIINKYRLFIFDDIHVPETLINQTIAEISKRGTGRGRKPKSQTKVKPNRVTASSLATNIESDTDTELVYIHTLYTQTFDRVAYAVTAKFNNLQGRIRILIPSEEIGWRDVRDHELRAYNEILRRRNIDRVSTFEENPIYGTIMSDGKFRIRDKTRENTTEAEKDARKTNRGRECITWKKPDLIEVLWNLRLYPEKNPSANLSEEQLRGYLVKGQGVSEEVFKTFSIDKARFFHNWYDTGYNRDQICTILKNHLDEQGLLLRVK